MLSFFSRMSRIYGHKWKSQYPDEYSVQQGMSEWLETFQAARLTPRMVDRGIQQSKRLEEWPPSHKRFVDLALDKPDPANAPLNASHRIFKKDQLLEKKPDPEKEAAFFEWVAATRKQLNQTQ